MNCIQKCLDDVDAITKRAFEELENIFIAKTLDLILDTTDGVYKVESNIDVKSNVTLAKWYHFQWFLNLQVKLFGRWLIY